MPNTTAIQMNNAVRRFKMAVNINGLIEIKLAVRSPAQCVDHVMGVFRAESGQHNAFLISLAVAINIFEMEQLGALADIRSAITRNNRRRDEQSLREDG